MQLGSEGKPLELAIQDKWLSLSNTESFMNAINIYLMSIGR